MTHSLAWLLLIVVAASVHLGDAELAVDLYGEAGCPYCAHFTVADVAPLFENGLSDLITFRYIAWGNAHNNTGPVRFAALAP